MSGGLPRCFVVRCAALGALLLGLAGCPDSEPADGSGAATGSTGAGTTMVGACTPGETMACTCPSGGEGVATCTSDGDAFSECVCSPGDSTGSGATSTTGTAGSDSGTTGGGPPPECADYDEVPVVPCDSIDQQRACEQARGCLWSGGTGLCYGMGSCDTWTQNCPRGEKCMPWAADGGGMWNAYRCSPISDNPKGRGETCSVRGGGTLGVDDCDLGLMCWNVDPGTNTGTCVGLCADCPAAETCDTFESCVVTYDILHLCLPLCDPVAQRCPAGEACYPVQDGFTCAGDASGGFGAYGTPCEFLNVCDPGLVCLEPAAVPGCAAAGCCTEICDLNDPTGDAQCTGQAGGQACIPWYPPGRAPEGLEHVGVCSAA